MQNDFEKRHLHCSVRVCLKESTSLGPDSVCVCVYVCVCLCVCVCEIDGKVMCVCVCVCVCKRTCCPSFIYFSSLPSHCVCVVVFSFSPPWHGECLFGLLR